MLLSKPGPLTACAAVAIACSVLVAACGGEPRGLSSFQAADLVLGQPNFESGQPNRGAGPTQGSLHSPGGMALTPEGGLLVADTGNNRVLFFSSVPGDNGAGATAVVGQPNFQSSAPSVTQAGLSEPWSVAVGAGRMAVAERASNRVVIYDRIPVAGRPMPVPSVVIGQPDFTSSAQSCGASGLHGPTAVAITPQGRLLVADRGNNRLLVWDQIPAAGAAVPPPSLVLGQSDTDHCAFLDDNQDGFADRDEDGLIARATARVMAPVDIWSDGLRLVVADGDNHRVLIWNTFPSTNFQPADLVVGQPDFVGTWPNGLSGRSEVLPSPTARTFYDPQGIHSDGTSLAIADYGNNRVLVWSTFPTVNYQAADTVLGHSSFDQSATNDLDHDGLPDAPSAQLFSRTSAVMFTADALFVADLRHHRVLRFRR